MFEILKSVGEAFRLPGKLYSYEVITQGNINTTYKVTYRNDDKKTKAYVFQKVNTNVFKNPIEIMKNIDSVTSHIRNKYPKEIVLHFHHTKTQENYYFDSDNVFWRVMNYIDSITYNSCDDLSIIASTGEAFGHFQMQLSDFDGSILYETIPDFHNTHKRLDTFFEHVSVDKMGRVEEIKEEIEYISSIKDIASILSDKFNNNEFPIRVTHNDTKCNNVLFDRISKRPIVVIDLDTVMPGMSMIDFGDAVRFIANTSTEDEPDLSKVFFDTAKFRAFCNGYLKEVRGSLKNEEIENLALATFTITIELATRFLDDYISGDIYFHTNYPGHNLVRARCQLRLAQDIMKKLDELNYIVNDELSKCLD